MENHTFFCIKKDIVEALTLYSPYFSKDFPLYMFSFDTSLIIVLTQKDDKKNKWPKYFMSTSLQGPYINYPTIDKQAYLVYKAVKHFWPYLLKKHSVSFVPHLEVI